MKKPLQPNNNKTQDLLFWIKEYIGSKVLTISVNKKHKDTFDRQKAYNQLMSATTIENFKAIQIDIRSKGLSTLISYANPMLFIYEFFENEKKIEKLTDFNTDFRDKMFISNKKNYSRNTQKGYLVHTNSLFKYIENNCEEEFSFNLGRTRGGAKTQSPIQDEDKEITYLSPNELVRFMRGLDTYRFRGDYTSKTKLLVKIAVFGGVRGEELISIKKSSISFEDSPTPLLTDRYMKIIIQGKGNKERAVYIRETLIKEEYNNHIMSCECEDDLLFCSKSGKQYTSSAIHQQITRLLAHVNIDKGTSGIHLLRRSYASYLIIKKNVDFAIVSELLGHENEEVTQLYIGINRKDMRGVEKVWDAF